MIKNKKHRGVSSFCFRSHLHFWAISGAALGSAIYKTHKISAQGKMKSNHKKMYKKNENGWKTLECDVSSVKTA